MANNHDQFIAFNDAITINSSKEKALKKNRKALRDRIKKYYKDNYSNEIAPKFKPQGSFAMQTILEPIKSEDNLGVFDLDDGIYFIDNSVNDRLSIDQYHRHIKDVVTGHTSIAPIDKDTCIRVEYSDGHHVDLPIYFKTDSTGSIPQLAHKSKGWINSDPKEFYEWFNRKADETPQLRRIVKYLKAWCDYKESINSNINMPSGCILTILAVEHFSAVVNRDDEALKNVLVRMYNSLSITFTCYRPTTPVGENLFAGYSDTRRNNFMDRLKTFKEDAERAIASSNPKEACEKWQNHFGMRFSCSTAKNEDENARQFSNPVILNNNNRFA